MADRDVLINENTMIAIANAIRNKSDSQTAYTPAQMPAAINQISGGSGGGSAITVTDTVDSHGGIIKTINAVDISDTTAIAGDVASGKVFYTADGTQTTGTASGGELDHWVRPSEWPNLSLLDRTNEVVYITCLADAPNCYIDTNVRTSGGGKYKLEIGHIANGEFIPDTTTELDNYTNTKTLIGADPSGYVVIRIIPSDQNNVITGFYIGNAYENQGEAGGVPVANQWNSALEVYGNLPNLRFGISARTSRQLVSFDVLNATPNTLNYAFSYCVSLVNLDVSTWDTSAVTNADSAFRYCPIKFMNGYESLDFSSVTSFGSAFIGSQLEEFDMTQWNVNMTGAYSFGNMFEGCTAKRITLAGKPSSVDSMLQNCANLEYVDISRLDTSATTTFRRFTASSQKVKTIVGLDTTDMTSVTNTQDMVQSKLMRSITLPATLTTITASSFGQMFSCTEFHFLGTTPPTLANTNAFPSMSYDRKIYVPYSEDHSILTAYQEATNWAAIADKIVEEEPE